MAPGGEDWLGKVTQVSPLLVERNSRPGPTTATPVGDFSGVAVGREVYGVTIERRRLVWLLPA
jgi:hypothetical protein